MVTPDGCRGELMSWKIVKKGEFINTARGEQHTVRRKDHSATYQMQDRAVFLPDEILVRWKENFRSG